MQGFVILTTALYWLSKIVQLGFMNILFFALPVWMLYRYWSKQLDRKHTMRLMDSADGYKNEMFVGGLKARPPYSDDNTVFYRKSYFGDGASTHESLIGLYPDLEVLIDEDKTGYAKFTEISKVLNEKMVIQYRWSNGFIEKRHTLLFTFTFNNLTGYGCFAIDGLNYRDNIKRSVGSELAKDIVFKQPPTGVFKVFEWQPLAHEDLWVVKLIYSYLDFDKGRYFI